MIDKAGRYVRGCFSGEMLVLRTEVPVGLNLREVGTSGRCSRSTMCRGCMAVGDFVCVEEIERGPRVAETQRKGRGLGRVRDGAGDLGMVQTA